ncbi:unnamed protein product [Debaryomyces fabryi]|nr:unnamed protein product [Debaryomyces fabryi]
MSLSNTMSSMGNTSGRGRTKIATGTTQPNKKLHTKLKSHNRSFSHNKVLNKLSTSSTPLVPTMGTRPNLNRSKSTDGLIRPTNRHGALKKNSRSFTKLTGLQPLTKTILNQSIKSSKSSGSLKGMNTAHHLGGLKTSGRKGKAILKLNDDDNDNNDYEDMENESVDDDNEDASAKENGNGNEINNDEKSLLPANFTNYENDKLEIKGPSQLPLERSLSGAPSARSSSEDLVANSNMYGGSLLLSQSTGLTRKINSAYNNNNSASPILTHKATDTHDSSMGSTNSESVSGISFKANPMDNVNKFQNNVAEPIITNKNVIQDNSYQPNQTIFNNLQRNNQTQSSSNKSISQNISSSNNGISNDQSLQSYLQQSNQPQHNIETRTQQRLWLQRENSLMDVVNVDPNRSNFSSLSLNNMMFAHNYNQSHQNIRDMPQVSNQVTGPVTPQNENGPYEMSNNSSVNTIATNNAPQPGNDHSNSISNINGLLTMVQNSHQNSIQSRTEFERLNREYLNVRRHLNPIGESLNRVEEIMKNTKEIKVTKKNSHKKAQSVSSVHSNSTNANTFKEFSPSFQEKEQEITSTLNKLWQEALILTLSLTSSSNSIRVNPPQPSQQPIQAQMQRSHNPRVPSYGQSPYSNLRSPQTPTTRAVKLAAQAQAAQAANTKRINEQHN